MTMLEWVNKSAHYFCVRIISVHQKGAQSKVYKKYGIEYKLKKIFASSLSEN